MSRRWRDEGHELLRLPQQRGVCLVLERHVHPERGGFYRLSRRAPAGNLLSVTGFLAGDLRDLSHALELEADRLEFAASPETTPAKVERRRAAKPLPHPDTPGSGGPYDCEHPNEAPHVCPCRIGCYCKTRTCRPAQHLTMRARDLRRGRPAGRKGA